MDTMLPNALMIGVDYDLFWTLNPKSLQPFLKAFELKQQYDDTIMWQQGMYIQMAIASVLNKSSNYPKKPYMDKTKDRVMTAQEIKAKVMAKAQIINSNFRKE